MLVVKVWFRPAFVSIKLPRFGFVLLLQLMASSDLLNVTPPALLVEGFEDVDDDEATIDVDGDELVSVEGAPC